MSYYREWRPYVPVAQRQANAQKEAQKLAKKGRVLRPIRITARTIATSFWGRAWCENLEKYADWANRIPRGRTYARNGSIIDLQIEPGKIEALVSGQELYKISIAIDPLPPKKWKSIRSDCAQQVSSMLDLMRGKLPDAVLARLTDRDQGMFPSPKELKPKCSCPDYATVCKHVAATLYGVGHLLDSEPSLFFKMRGVDQSELISEAMSTAVVEDSLGLNQESNLDGEDLGAMFGIELATTQEPVKTKPARAPQKPTSKKASTKKGVKKTVKKAAKKVTKKTTQGTAKKTPKKKITVKATSTKAAVSKKRTATKKKTSKPRSKA